MNGVLVLLRVILIDPDVLTRKWQSSGFGLFPLLVPLLLDVHRGPAPRLFHDLVAFLASLGLLQKLVRLLERIECSLGAFRVISVLVRMNQNREPAVLLLDLADVQVWIHLENLVGIEIPVRGSRF